MSIVKQIFRNLMRYILINPIRTIMIIGGFLGMGMVLWGLATWLSPQPKDTQDPLAQTFPVEVAHAQEETLQNKLNAIGTLIASESVMIRSEMGGRIKQIHFKDGQTVQIGDPLVSMDDEFLAVKLRSAEANLKKSKSEYERKKILIERKIVSKMDWDKISAEYEHAQAIRDEAKLALERSIIRAPITGTIGIRSKDISVGAIIGSNHEIVSLVNYSPLKVDFRVPGAYNRHLLAGQKIDVTIDGYENRVFQAEIEAVDARIENQGNALLIRAAIPNEDNLLKPGLFVRATVVTGEKSGAITVPEIAIERKMGKEFLFRVKNNRAMLTPVETGIRQNGRIEILRGLSKKDTVIVSGQSHVQDGAMVKIVETHTNLPESKSNPSSKASTDSLTEHNPGVEGHSAP